MDIRNRRALKQEAAEALNAAREPRKILLIYLGASMLLSLVLSLVDIWLSDLISNMSGLGNLGNRTILETVRTVLPYGQMLVVVCWDLGFLGAMLRIGRRQHADEKTLLTGFQIFGPALRSLLLQALIYMGVMFVCCYVGSFLFVMTPFANPLAEILMPLMEDASLLSGELALDEATILAMYDAMLPALIIILLLCAAVMVPISYRFRMVNYCLLDDPQAGALAAMRSSRAMMRGNCKHLFKLDLSFWWYYALTMLASVVCYGDVILGYLGVTLPMSERASYFLFYGLYYVVLFGVNWLCRSKVETSYAMAYEAIRPKPQQDGVILGNIFQM